MISALRVLERRESRLDALVEKIEGGYMPTNEDWKRFDLLNDLDLMTVAVGSSREAIEAEILADYGVLPDVPSVAPERADG